MGKIHKENNLNKSKLIKLLAKLPDKLVKQFKTWYKLQGSPKRDAYLVFKHLLLYYPDFESSNLQHQTVFRKIFGKLPYNYRRLMKASSQVHVDLKKYLLSIELEEDDFLTDYLMAKIYTKYDLVHERALLLAKKLSPKNDTNQPPDFHQIMVWNELSYFTERQNNQTKQEERVSIAMDALDHYHLGKKLKYICEIVTQEKLHGKRNHILWKNEFKSYCQTHFNSLPAYHQAYYLAWQLVQSGKQSDFDQLKAIFKAEHAHFPKAEQLYLLTHLLNYTSQQIRKKVTNALEVAFDLYLIGIDNNILMIDQFFIAAHFKNIIAFASALKKFNWIEQFLQTSLSLTVKKNDPANFNLALARYRFAKKDYPACIGHLIGIDYNQYSQSNTARIYQIACAYELKEPPHILEAHCKSFENYLRRNIDKYPLRIKANLKFIQFVRQLNKVNPNIHKLQKSLDTTTGIAFIVWLQEKIIELR